MSFPPRNAKGNTDFLAVARATAPHLGQQWRPEQDAHEHCAVLVHTTGLRIALRSEWNTPDRITASGVYPASPHGRPYGTPHHKITVRADRGPKVLAAEISRRLLPDYTASFRKVAEYQAAEDAYSRELAQVVTAVLERLPGSRLIDHSVSSYRSDIVRYGALSGGPTTRIRVLSAGDRADIEITDLPRRWAEEIYAVLARVYAATEPAATSTAAPATTATTAPVTSLTTRPAAGRVRAA